MSNAKIIDLAAVRDEREFEAEIDLELCAPAEFGVALVLEASFSIQHPAAADLDTEAACLIREIWLRALVVRAARDNFVCRASWAGVLG